MLAGLLGGMMGGGAMSPSSSTAQSSPFYNDAGIYFNSPGAGGIEAGDVGATATPGGSKQLQGGYNPQSASSMDYGYGAGADSISYYLMIAGGILVLLIGAFFIFKKK